MLILSRKENESIYLGQDIEIKIVEISKGSVKIGIEAPKNINILRGELKKQIQDLNLKATKTVNHSMIKDFHEVLNAN